LRRLSAVAIIVNDTTTPSAGSGAVLLWSELARATTFLAAALVSDNLSRARNRT